jgi:HEAT repeat protein
VARASASLKPSQTETEPETARLISLMLDKSLSIQLRRDAARSLGKIGTDEAMSALKSALANDNPPYLKAAIAEGLGESPNPEARDLLHGLLNGKDETTARGAARGLALRGDSDAVDTLGTALFNEQTPLGVRTEAALALGDVNLPGAQDLLTKAISQIQDEDVRESVLDGLGRRPFSDTEQFFRDYLNSADVPPDSKVLAIQAITDAEGDVGPFLSNYLNDANADVRAAAKSAVDFIGPE